MTQKYYTIITTIGARKITNAAALGTQVNLTEMAVGDGGGRPITPVETDTALRREVYRGGINRLEVDVNNSNQIIAELVIAEDVGDFTIREVGVFDQAGNLFAIGNLPETYKPVAASGSARTQTIRMVIQVSNTAAVQLKIDPSIIIATREYVDAAMLKNAYRVESIAELRALRGKSGAVVVTGYYADKPGIGGGVFVADTADKATADNGGTVVVSADGTRWRRYADDIQPEYFGARADGIADDTAALLAAAAAATKIKRTLRGGGKYKLTQTLNLRELPVDMPAADFVVSGDGQI
ncbi:phage tail protein, partial [Neisseria sp. S1]|uniref:phage tail-collar fiber domain-containing protein n=1 Tax=Neisseria sp. S1 TaxID=3318354 RepID=UPI003A8989C5